MIRIGDYNTLTVARSTSVGVFLEDEEGTEILLPNKYVPKEVQLNQPIKVFCYLDHEERPVATTLDPLVYRDRFALLKVAQVNKIGAFLDWGLEKQLLVPFKEQKTRLEEGEQCLVYCFLDESSFRLVASTKLDRFLKVRESTYKAHDQVSLIASRKTNLGWEMIIDHQYKGLLFFSDVFKDLQIGDHQTGYIKHIRPDGKIDLSLEPIGVKVLDAAADKVLQKLTAEGGFLPLNDKSSPEEIKQILQISKKAFKKGVGVLYKQRKISILPNGISLKK